MIICPIEGVVIFDTCQAKTCMWNNGGQCKNGMRENRIPKNLSECSPEQLEAMDDIKQVVTVGLFLEAVSGKKITSIKESDVPDRLTFETWALKRKVSISAIDYNSAVRKILTNL